MEYKAEADRLVGFRSNRLRWFAVERKVFVEKVAGWQPFAHYPIEKMDDNDKTEASDLGLEEEFMALLIQNEPMLRAYARSILPNWDRVDEVIQEASITMWKKLDQLRDKEGFPAWSRVVVRLKCLEAIASMKREQKVFSEGVIELLLAESENIECDRREGQRKCVRRCLDEFSLPHRELLLAPYSGRGRIQEIAMEQGRSANALYKLLGRLRDKLNLCVRRKLVEEGLSDGI